MRSSRRHGAAVVAAIVGLLASPAWSADLGQNGAVFDIGERSILEFIAERSGAMVASGEWDRVNGQARERGRQRVERPDPVLGLTPAVEGATFTYDPTIVAPQDYDDGFGNVVVAKGTTANPLDVVGMPYELVFFDADRPAEREYALERYRLTNGNIRMVLTRGAPMELMREHKLRFYFDQKGLMTTQLGIRHTPSRVFQTGRVLTVEEVPVLGRPHMSARIAEDTTP